MYSVLELDWNWTYTGQTIKNRLFYFRAIFAYLQIAMAELLYFN
jgi:hypothetical protein